jgi:hypothetical protein
MRRVTAWIGGVASGVVAYRFWRRHQATEVAPEPEAPAEPDARADELRAKLAETRDAEPEPPPEAVVAQPEPAVEPEAEERAAEPDEPDSPDERRSRVHEEGRAALDDMKSE